MSHAIEIPPSIFRAYDIRGIAGRTLTAEGVHAIGRAIGSVAVERGETRAFLGRDGRLSGPELSAALGAGLEATGLEVVDIGLVPTPVLYFAVCEFGSGTGVMLTGSHNPPDYNGLKIMIAGDTLAEDGIQDLRRRIESGDLQAAPGRRRSQDVLPAYIERIVGDVHLSRALRVVVDCGNGVAGIAAPRLLRALGCEVTELYCDVDGRFPNHHPDPSVPENLEALRAAVLGGDADLGLAFDGDGDRLGVLARDGRVIWPDRLLMLLAVDVLARNPGARILYDVKCSRHLDAAIRAAGGEPEMWKTGHSLIKARMRETGALLAGEMSGHVFFKERWYGFDDALYTAARLLEVLAADRRDPTAVFAALPDSVNTPELHVEMGEGEHFRFMERFAREAHFEGAAVRTIDGVRADFADGWGLVRASNTTPCLVLRFEAEDEAGLHRIQEIFRRRMLAVEPELALPF